MRKRSPNSGSNSKSIQAFSEFYYELGREEKPSSSRLKFIVLLLSLQGLPVVQQWVLSHKMALRLEKTSLVESVASSDLLDVCIREICNRL